jgi:hypothetical protein
MRMETKRRQQVLLAVLIVVLAGAGYRAWTSMTSAVPLPTSNGTGAAAPRRPRNRPRPPRPTCGSKRSKRSARSRGRPSGICSGSSRNRRRHRRNRSRCPVAPPVPTGPPPPPPPPPIPYKFIGKLEGPGQTGRIAVLSDGRGTPLYGREGDIIEGRFRILRIGAESIEMEHIDGRGRQTIRLGGS